MGNVCAEAENSNVAEYNINSPPPRRIVHNLNNQNPHLQDDPVMIASRIGTTHTKPNKSAPNNYNPNYGPDMQSKPLPMLNTATLKSFAPESCLSSSLGVMRHSHQSNKENESSYHLNQRRFISMNIPHSRAQEIEAKRGSYLKKIQVLESQLIKPSKGVLLFEQGATYQGGILNGKRHGIGRQVWKDGSVYEGQWKNGVFDGKGRMIFVDGDYFEGDFRYGISNGIGFYHGVDGTTYEGHISKDQFEGQGVETWIDGSVYKGEFQNSMKNGIGTFNWEDGSKYYGEFKDNQVDGKGLFTWKDGREYEGEWRQNKMEGNGLFRWPDGKVYKGQYKDDLKHGYGILRWYASSSDNFQV